MLPTITFNPPIGNQWVYETKYDGFRALLYLDENVQFISRNGKDLLPSFPEVNDFFKKYRNKFASLLPVILDGELTILVNPYKSDFSKVQRRGRLKKKENIQFAIKEDPATYLAFDLLEWKGTNIQNKPYVERKKLLQSFIRTFSKFEKPIVRRDPFIQMIPYEKDFNILWQKILAYGGEGIVAKQIDSSWRRGIRSNEWVKLKNWQKINVFITAYDQTNGYFHVGVYDELGAIRPVGLFKNGLTKKEKESLEKVVKANAQLKKDRLLYINPSICVELLYLEWYENKLREPYFSKFLFHTSPKSCTFKQILEKSQPVQVEITHPNKRLWKNEPGRKKDYIDYLRKIYPYMSPFLKNRVLTVIRYPHGMFGEAFFQKNCPTYAPNFVETYEEKGIRYILCNNVHTLIWLGNQLAIEFHIPFRSIERKHPSELVIDLDPPSKAEFHLAVEAASIIKEDIIDPLGLTAFLKVSGKRGLHLYIPFSSTSPFTWEDTRMFAHFIANYLATKKDSYFTTERLKKLRRNRLYIDYVQYGEGKTIIAPFSVRGNEKASVAAPIFWEELHKPLVPDGFSMPTVLNRLSTVGNPFKGYFQTNNDQPIKEILSFLQRNTKSFQ
ncbi:DNA ligase D [Fervidibacillus halotolerans]|uniref:DNA ligase (ATP) n=1 Tax=Fervidibacillus halotolerans TaxID=2980027 RepID=A0A9E8M249_9BACI|nr:DNA ligase D [Fervidibacillus halotolerans]WAA13879.1 DNA ligase D [Fervidibacillus halotolerans]